MSSSFFAILDDIAVLAKAAAASVDDVVAGAAKASAKAAGVVIDDAAVSPQYVQGITPSRELPVVWRITRGSLVNKAIIIVAAMLLSQFAPWIFPWLLVLGGSYLVFEGAEKVLHWVESLRGHAHAVSASEVSARSVADEKAIARSAIRTDFVLSTEIMLIALVNIEASNWVLRLATLLVVGLVMTIAVYGVVGLLVKMDDVGLWLSRKTGNLSRAFGHGLVRAMPVVFKLLSVVGTLAMLWVGGHILLVNLAELGWEAPHHFIAELVHPLHDVAIAAWLVESALSAVAGLLWGAVLVVILHFGKRIFGRKSTSADAH